MRLRSGSEMRAPLRQGWSNTCESPDTQENRFIFLSPFGSFVSVPEATLLPCLVTVRFPITKKRSKQCTMYYIYWNTSYSTHNKQWKKCSELACWLLFFIIVAIQYGARQAGDSKWLCGKGSGKDRDIDPWLLGKDQLYWSLVVGTDWYESIWLLPLVRHRVRSDIFIIPTFLTSNPFPWSFP